MINLDRRTGKITLTPISAIRPTITAGQPSTTTTTTSSANQSTSMTSGQAAITNLTPGQPPVMLTPGHHVTTVLTRPITALVANHTTTVTVTPGQPAAASAMPQTIAASSTPRHHSAVIGPASSTVVQSGPAIMATPRPQSAAIGRGPVQLMTINVAKNRQATLLPIRLPTVLSTFISGQEQHTQVLDHVGRATAKRRKPVNKQPTASPRSCRSAKPQNKQQKQQQQTTTGPLSNNSIRNIDHLDMAYVGYGPHPQPESRDESPRSIRNIDHMDAAYSNPYDSFSAMEHCSATTMENVSEISSSSIYASSSMNENIVREIPIFPSEDMDVKFDCSLTTNSSSVHDADDSNSSFNMTQLNRMEISSSETVPINTIIGRSGTGSDELDELNLPSISSDTTFDFSVEHTTTTGTDTGGQADLSGEGQDDGSITLTDKDLEVTRGGQSDHVRYTNKTVKLEADDYEDIVASDQNDHVMYSNSDSFDPTTRFSEDQNLDEEAPLSPDQPDHQYQALPVTPEEMSNEEEEVVDLDLDQPEAQTMTTTMTQIIPLIPEKPPRPVPTKRDQAKRKSTGLELKDGADPKSLKKKQKILQKVIRRRLDENECCDFEYRKEADKDTFNLSNDEYYSPVYKNGQFLQNWFDVRILHSLPAQDLDPVLYPPDLPENYLRHFHRLPLAMSATPDNYVKCNTGKFCTVKCLNDYILKKSKHREDQRLATGGGPMFYMRTVEDLSGKDGELILCEYSEENPPILMQPGMATKVKHLIEKNASQNPDDITNKNNKYGESVQVSSKDRLFYLLGQLEPGQRLHVLENTLFRAPMYEHKVPETDFLVVIDNKGIFVRPVEEIFCVGQQCPLYEVPAPNAYKTTNFLRDFLLAYIYRLFWMSNETPRRLKSEVLRQLFPSYAESTIRKRLKSCSLFTRLGNGTENNFWLLNHRFNLPSLERIRELVTPEMYCAHLSMMTARQRLKDAGYGDEANLVNLIDDDDDGTTAAAGGGGGDNENKQPKIDDEIKCAPWNTTRAFLNAAKGKSMLDLVGVADPTGRGEGYSYVKMSLKASANALLSSSAYEDKFGSWDIVAAKVKRCINGTDADLRKLSLNQARQLLRDLGVQENEIRMLKRWEIIDIIRTFSTRQARDHRVFSEKMGLTKFARGCLKYSPAEVYERFRKECQRIFDLQNRVLSNTEYMSTDEEEEEDEDSDVELVAEIKDIPLCNSEAAAMKKPDIVVKKEEISGDEGSNSAVVLENLVDDQQNFTKIKEKSENSSVKNNRKLKIYRTYYLNDGREYVNCEIVAENQLIDAYLKLRTSKDEEFISRFAKQDKDYKAEKRKEKRRLQDKLRRIKRNELKAQMGISTQRRKSTLPAKPPKPKSEALLKMRCSACGGTGHMKTNKCCPMFVRHRTTGVPQNRVRRERRGRPRLSEVERPTSAMSRTTEDDDVTDDDDDGYDEEREAEELSDNASMSIDNINEVDRDDDDDDSSSPVSGLATTAPNQKTPFVRVEGTKVNINKRLLNESVPPPLHRVDESDEDYVEKPPPRRKRRKLEKSVSSANKNSSNDQPSPKATPPSLDTAHDYTNKAMRPNSQQQSQQTRRCRSDPKVQLCNIFEGIIDELRDLPEAKYFLKPVSKKSFPAYYEMIEKPMHLSMIKVNVSKNLYSNRREFFADLRLILENSQKFNGETSGVTQCAETLVQYAKEQLKNDDAYLRDLECRINPSYSFQQPDDDLCPDNDQKSESIAEKDHVTLFNRHLFDIVTKCKSMIPRYFVTNVDQRRTIHRRSKKQDHFVDVNSIEANCANRHYKTVGQFLADFECMCEASDVVKARATLKAKEIYAFVKRQIQEDFEALNDLQQKVTDGAPLVKQETPSHVDPIGQKMMTSSSNDPVSHRLPTVRRDMNAQLSEIDRRSGNFFNDAVRIKIEIVDLEDSKPSISKS